MFLEELGGIVIRTSYVTCLVMLCATAFADPTMTGGSYFVEGRYPLPTGGFLYSGYFHGDLYFNRGKSDEVYLRGVTGSPQCSWFFAKVEADKSTVIWARNSIDFSDILHQRATPHVAADGSFLVVASIDQVGATVVGKDSTPVRYTRADGERFVARFDSAGTVLWSTIVPVNLSLLVTAEGNTLLESYGGRNGGTMIKVDGRGKFVWQRTIGGTGAISIRAAQVLADGSVVFAGEFGGYPRGRYSEFGDRSGGTVRLVSDSGDDDPAYDIFITEIDSDGYVTWTDAIWNYYNGGRPTALEVTNETARLKVGPRYPMKYLFKPGTPQSYELTGQSPTVEYSLAGEILSVTFE